MKDIIILAVIIFAVAPAIIILRKVIPAGIKSRKRLKESFDQIAVKIGGRTNTSFFSLPGVEGNYKGIPVKIIYNGGGEDTLPYFKITFSRKPPFWLTLYEENSLTTFGKKLRLVKEVVLNVPDFDEKFFIRTNDKMRSIVFLSDSRNRETIMHLHQQGWRLTFGKSAVEVQKVLKTKTTEIAANWSKEGTSSLLRTFLPQANSPGFFQTNLITPDEVVFLLESLYQLRY
ncbi:MAG: hypothetical protein V2A65_00145 [Candidatus Omnitrophota bacterium]